MLGRNGPYTRKIILFVLFSTVFLSELIKVILLEFQKLSRQTTNSAENMKLIEYEEKQTKGYIVPWGVFF